MKFKGQYAKFMNRDDKDKDDNPFDSGYQVISSKMNDAGAASANFYGNGALMTPSNPLGSGRNDEVPF